MKKIFLVVSSIVLGIIAAFLFNVNQPVSVGSVQDGNAYTGTSTIYTWAGNSGGFQAIKSGQGVLGSIVIGNATAVGTISLYDGTTTVNGALYGTTTLATINTGSLAGTYTYDVAFTKGLIAVISSTLATSSITFR